MFGFKKNWEEVVKESREKRKLSGESRLVRCRWNESAINKNEEAV